MAISTNIISIYKLLGVPLAALALATPASAATIVQNFSVGYVNRPSSFTLQQFDPGLGLLTSVEVLISPLTEIHAANPAPAPGANIFDLRGFITLDAANASAPALPGWENSVTTGYSTFSSPYELSVGGPNQITTITTGLASFTGLSAYSYAFNAGVDVLSATEAYGSTLANRSKAVVRVTYNYDEAVAAVPEPSTWAMTILGFGAIGGAMRQKRKGHASLSFT